MQAPSQQLLKKYLQSYMRDEELVLESNEVQDLMLSINSIIKKDVAESNLAIYEEIKTLSMFIKSFKDEIGHLFQDDVKSNTTDVLDVVLKTTEDAVENILDCAEGIDEIALDASSDLKERLSDISTRIYEASNFQDINGQRIIKVIKALNLLADKSDAILQHLGIDNNKTPNNEELMSGPQDPGKGISQDEIDKLLAEL